MIIKPATEEFIGEPEVLTKQGYFLGFFFSYLLEFYSKTLC